MAVPSVISARPFSFVRRRRRIGVRVEEGAVGYRIRRQPWTMLGAPFPRFLPPTAVLH